MRAVPAAHGWHLLPNERAGRRPPSRAPATPRRPLRLKARGSAGACPPTAPGQRLWICLSPMKSLNVLDKCKSENVSMSSLSRLSSRIMQNGHGNSDVLNKNKKSQLHASGGKKTHIKI